MSAEAQKLFLVRLASELTTKARGTRRRFTQRLVDNIRDALSTTGEKFRVESHWTRLFVSTRAAGAAELLARVPGISSVSEVVARCDAELDQIVRVGVEHFADAVKGRRYAVRTHRSGTHPFTSADVNRALGAALNPGAKVDLTNPEVEVEVEVRDEVAYLFSGRRAGLGGLPLGVEGRALCLISGGFDSAVAAWLMLKRGVALDYLFCNLAGDAYERAVVQVAKVLSDEWSYGYQPKLYVVDFGPPVDALRAGALPRYWQLVLKRYMYRAATEIGTELHAHAIVTGESLGQVSSQTLPNLRAIEDAAGLPVFRPLLGFDKQEIVALTRRIGTFELSSKVKEYCAISPGNPVTGASPEAAQAEEAKTDLGVLRRATAARRVLELKGINRADLVESYLFTERVPEGAVVIDARSEDEWDEWHYPGATRLEAWALPAQLGRMDRDRVYVVYCDAGLQAAVFAEQMQRQGIEAYALRGGTKALREQASGSPAV